MSLTSRSVATATDFNSLLAGVLSLYGVGSGDRGYGQTALALDPIKVGQRITAAQWGILRGMLGVCVAQEGLDPSILPEMPQVGVVTPSATAFSDALNTVDAGRFAHAFDAMTVVSDVVIGKMTSIWNGVLQLTIDVDFMSEDEARYFFNSGGRITLTPSHNTVATSYDTTYSAFLARQVGTISIGAHETTWSAGSLSGETLGGYYGFEPSDSLVLSQDSSTSTSQGFPDSVRVRIRRTNFSGVNSGNGRSFQISVQMQYLGDAAGSILSSGTQVSVGLVYASKYLKVATPNIAVTNFSLISKGNDAVTSPDTGEKFASVPPVDVPRVFSPDVGTMRYTVPEYATLTVELSGAGGSEGSSTGPYPRADGSAVLIVDGEAGGDTSIGSLGLTATGGGGGGSYNPKTAKTGPAGVPGIGKGGDVNNTGGGSPGGSGAYPAQDKWHNGSPGGAGGYARKIFVRGAADAPAPGSVLVAVVPGGGSLVDTAIPTDPPTVFYPGADGARGLATISASGANSGTVSFSIPGSYQFRVPTYASLTFSVRGAGGGAAHSLSPALSDEDPVLLARDGAAGGDASVVFLNLVATGGQGGRNEEDPGFPGPPSPVPGVAGTGTGGDVNADGLGGEGGGAATGLSNGGGGGGYAMKTVRPGDPGAPIVGQTLLVIVPAGGLGAEPSPLSQALGITNPSGQDGNVTITWVVAEQPSATGSVLVIS